MRNINYMTDEQKADMEYFSSLANQNGDTENLYIVSSGTTWDEALSQSGIISRDIDSLVNSGMATRCNEVNSFLTSREEQE